MDTYQELDAYAITQLPEPMEKDVGIPSCIGCGTFKERIQEIHLFASAKGGQTLLHRDPYSSIHCVFNGSKDWVLIHPRQLQNLYMSDSSSYEWGGFSEVDPMNVDLKQFPLIADLEISDVHLNKGDCIFMPGGYWHFVRVQGYMNTAVSIWLSRIDHYQGGSCVHDETNSDMPSADHFPIIWRYSGFGNLTQGHMDIFILKKVLLSLKDKDKNIRLNDFVQTFMVLSEENSHSDIMKQDLNARKLKFLDYFNTSTDDVIITSDEIEQLSISQLKDLVEIIHPNDVSNTDQYEYSHLRSEDIRLILDGCFYQKSSSFDLDCIRRRYTKELGGSLAKADQIIEKLLASENEMLDISNKVNIALTPYDNSVVHDPELERQLYMFLVNKKEIRDHDEL